MHMKKQFGFIEYRPRSVLEVHDRLVRYGVEIKVIEKSDYSIAGRERAG